MELDHDSGRMEGRCLKGKFAGRTLSALTDEELILLLEELRVRTPKARSSSRPISTGARQAGATGLPTRPQARSRGGVREAA